MIRATRDISAVLGHEEVHESPLRLRRNPEAAIAANRRNEWRWIVPVRR